MVYLLEPKFVDKIWGGNYIRDNYYSLASTKCGEVWGISAHKSNPSIIANGEFHGKTLAELFESNRELFGNYQGDEFPILVKIIEAKNDLSIQVHPDDEYAKKKHNSLGKTESWTILDAKENAHIIVGHNAKTKEGFKQAVKNKDYDNLLNKLQIRKGDTLDILPGTVHAICSGTVLLEVQQSSNITYRVYDYDRLENGEPRKLHLEDALNVIKYPSGSITNYAETDFYKYEIHKYSNEKLVSDIYGDYLFVVNGEGRIGNIEVKKGAFLFVPSSKSYMVDGDLELTRIKIKK